MTRKSLYTADLYPAPHGFHKTGDKLGVPAPLFIGVTAFSGDPGTIRDKEYQARIIDEGRPSRKNFPKESPLDGRVIFESGFETAG